MSEEKEIISREELSYFLTEMRKTAKLSDYEVAKKCGFDVVEYQMWEAGIDIPYRLETYLYKFREVIKEQIRRNRGDFIE